jgi:hypothetical protein
MQNECSNTMQHATSPLAHIVTVDLIKFCERSLFSSLYLIEVLKLVSNHISYFFHCHRIDVGVILYLGRQSWLYYV